MKLSGFNSSLYLGTMAKVLGINADLGDRLPRSYARELIAYVQKHRPDLASIAGDRSHPDFKAVRRYAEMLQYFAYEHPQDADGAPSAWPSRGQRGAQTEENPFGNLFPDEVAELLEWAPTDPEYRSVANDKTHPNHAAVMERTVMATQLAGPSVERTEAPLSGEDHEPSPFTKSQPAGDTEAAKREIAALKADKNFLADYHETAKAGPRAEAHKVAVARMTALYERAFPAVATAAPASTEQPRVTPQTPAMDAGGAKAQIAALRTDKSFLADYHETAKAGPRFAAHQAAVSRMSALHEAAFPTTGPSGPALAANDPPNQ